MNLRNVHNEASNVANLCFVAGLGLFVSGQWAMLGGDEFGFAVLTAFGKSRFSLSLVWEERRWSWGLWGSGIGTEEDKEG